MTNYIIMPRYLKSKTLFCTLIFTILALTSFTQIKSDSSRHLLFKGVPIDGTLNEFISRMKKAGFTQSGTKDGIAFLKGDFASYKNCIIGVSTLKQKDLVSKIAVVFPDRDIWSSLSSNYFNLKDMLTEKYGKPTDEIEEFQSYTPDDDGSKITQIQLGACKYLSTYETEKGTIQLSIEHDGITHCYVKLAYFDKINSGAVKKGALDDL